MKTKELLVFSLINLIVFFSLTRSAFLTPFNAYGDCDIIALTNPTPVNAFKEDVHNFNSFVNNLKYESRGGRFWPLSDAIHFIRARCFGLHPFYYHLTNFLAGVLTTVFLFSFLRCLGVTLLVAYLVSFIFETAPYAELWYRINETEPWGAFFLVFSLALFARAIAQPGEKIKNKKSQFTYYFASLMLFCACLCKESFPFTVPFVVLLIIVFYAYKNNLDFLSAAKQTKNILIVLLLVMIIPMGLVAATIFLAKTDFHYGHSTSYIKNAKSNLILILRPFLFLFPVIILLFVAFRNRKFDRVQKEKLYENFRSPSGKFTIKNLFSALNQLFKINPSDGKPSAKISLTLILSITIIFTGWVVMQLIVYSNNTMWIPRYLIPAAIAPIILLAFLIDYFNRPKLKKYYFFILAIYLMVLGYRFYKLNSEASGNQQFAQAYNNLLDFIIDKHIQSVGIYGAPIFSYEFIRTASFLLSAKNLNVDFFFIPDKNQVSSFWTDVNNRLMDVFPSRCRVVSLQDVPKTQSEWIVIIGKTSGLPSGFPSPAFAYPYQGYTWTFNLSAFRFEKAVNPFFLLIKTYPI